MAGLCATLSAPQPSRELLGVRTKSRPGSEGVDAGARARTDQQGATAPIPLPSPSPAPSLSPNGEPKAVMGYKDKVSEEHRGCRVVFACCVGEVRPS